MKKISELELKIFDTTHPESDLRSCESAYRLYKSQWSETFQELRVDKRIRSDGFLNRKLIGYFESELKCVGFVLLSAFDISRFSMRDQSYFEPYPFEVVGQMRSLGHCNVMAFSALTVADDWRRAVTEIPIADIVVGIGTTLFMDSDATALICYTRNESIWGTKVFIPNLLNISKNI